MTFEDFPQRPQISVLPGDFNELRFMAESHLFHTRACHRRGLGRDFDPSCRSEGLVYDFPNVAGDARFPGGALTQGRDGNLYGVSAADESNSLGVIYQLTPAGAETGLHHFLSDGSEGTYCSSYTAGAWGLTLASDGNFYGACEGGGTPSNSCGGDYGCGTVYKITPTGTLTTVHSFSHLDGNGISPEGALFLSSDGNFYGTATGGGSGGCGTGLEGTPK